jgi:predicted nuclease with TOPRIM domain
MSNTKKYSQMKREMEKLNAKKKSIMDECTKKGMSYEDYQNEVRSIMEEIYFLNKEIRKIQDPVLVYGKEWKGNLHTMDNFIGMSINGDLTDEDGYGYYATDNAKSDIIIYPSDILDDIYRSDFTHVVWFNK